MQDVLKTRVGRTVGRIAAVGAVGLVLAGAVATPAEARTRREARNTANNDGGMCFETGGSHYATDSGFSFQMACVWEDGTMTEWELPYAGE